MRTAQLMSASALALAMAAGCNRDETNDQAQRAAADVKIAAARAGDRLADGWLTTRIQAQYFADKEVKGRYIDVSSDNGVVTIKGFVETPAARERALQIARSTTGVKQINDQLLIGQSPKAFEAGEQPVATTGRAPTPAGPSPAPNTTAAVDSADVTANIQAKYFLDPTLKGRQIDVATQNGVVTVGGEVASEGERAQALLLARTTNGVQRVEDHLTVNAVLDQPGAHPASPAGAAGDAATAAADVKTKLAADPQLQSVDASVDHGVVQLQGTVPTKAARQRALDLARTAPGVTQVIDRLTIAR